MRIFIEPNEPLLFRTGRPFDAGQDTFAESLFPPTPETLQGAVRATIATYWDTQKSIAEAFKDTELTNRIGDREHYGRFRITGLTLGRYGKTKTSDKENDKGKPLEVERLFPSPAHIVNYEKRPHRLVPHSLEERLQGKTVATNFPDDIRYYLAPKEDFGTNETLEPLGGWLTETDLYRTLGTGNIADIQTITKEAIYREEPRLGIGIQRGTKATQEGFLYQTVMVRMNHCRDSEYRYGFVVDIRLASHPSSDTLLSDTETQAELHFPPSGVMTIGGEQRTAQFWVVESPQAQKRTFASHKRLLYLATPATFSSGWRPTPEFAPLDAPLTAAIQRYESIGGWRLNSGNANGENKAMQRCVPAGSVYFFDKEVVLPEALTDYGMEIGYGIIYEGEWK